MQPTDTYQTQHTNFDLNEADILTAGEAVLDRVKAISRHISERVRELTGQSVEPQNSGSD
jgi:hypothetical protein